MKIGTAGRVTGMYSMYTLLPLESRYTFSPRKGPGDTLCNNYVFVTRLGPVDKKVIEVAKAFWIPVFRSDDDDGYENDENQQNFFLGYNTLNSLQASNPAAVAMGASFPYHFVQPTPQQVLPKSRNLVTFMGNLSGGERACKTLYKHVLDGSMLMAFCSIGRSNRTSSSIFRRAKYVLEFLTFQDWVDAIDLIHNSST